MFIEYSNNMVKHLNNIMLVSLLVGISLATLSASIIFNHQAIAQTPSLSITDQICVNGEAVSTVTFTEFPEGSTVFTRSDIAPAHLTTFLMPSSGTFTLDDWPLITGTYTYTAFSDPNRNGLMDPGEVFAQTTVTTIDCSSPPQQIQNLINTINGMNLDNSVKNSLTAPINQAVNILTDNNPNNDVAVCNRLNAFTSEVNTKLQNNQLSQEQANQLIQSVESIKIAQGCT